MFVHTSKMPCLALPPPCRHLRRHGHSALVGLQVQKLQLAGNDSWLASLGSLVDSAVTKPVPLVLIRMCFMILYMFGCLARYVVSLPCVLPLRSYTVHTSCM
jgi:hypothetical protein